MNTLSLLLLVLYYTSSVCDGFYYVHYAEYTEACAYPIMWQPDGTTLCYGTFPFGILTCHIGWEDKLDTSRGCSDHGKCVRSTATYSPHLILSQPATWGECICEVGYMGRFCELSSKWEGGSDVTFPTYKTWRYSMPYPDYPLREHISYVATNGRLASIAYGYHVLAREYSYYDAAKARESTLEYAISGSVFHSEWMTRPKFYHPTRFYVPVRDFTWQVRLIRGSTHNCPAGMIAIGPNEHELYCSCDPAQEKRGCNGQGICHAFNLNSAYEHSEGDRLALQAWRSSPSNVYASIPTPLTVLYYFFDPITLEFTGRTAEILNFYGHAVLPRGMMDWTESLTYNTACLCDDDTWAGYYCELDIANQVKCSGHGTWDSRGKICDCEPGWGSTSGSIGCNIPNPDIILCKGHGEYNAGSKDTHPCTCTNIEWWGKTCEEPCDTALCNGHGSCQPNSGAYDDGLTGVVPSFRVSNKCKCKVDGNDGLEWHGNHCQIKSLPGVICDNHGTILDIPPSPLEALYTLADQVCSPKPYDPELGIKYTWNLETGRTWASCPSSYPSVLNEENVYDWEIGGILNTYNPLNQCGGTSRGYPVYTSSTADCKCTCLPGFFGDACEKERCLRHHGQMCSGRGECVGNKCKCEPGHAGDRCQFYDDGSCQHNTQYSTV